MKIILIIAIAFLILFVLVGFFCALVLDYNDYKAVKYGTKSVDERLEEIGVKGFTSSGHYIK